MKHWKEYRNHQNTYHGKRKKVDATIYSFDTETTSYVILDGDIYPAIEYQNFTKDEQERCEYKSTMYIWTFSINDQVYYGRHLNEFRLLLNRIETNIPYRKIIFIQNLSFEFQYLKGKFNFKNVMARKSHKVMKCEFEDYNIELRCTYFMSNCALAYLPKLFNLPVEKKVGDLDYTKIRTTDTELTEKELGYCEHDNLVIYYYILEELKTYERVDKIPLTSTGHVRKELKDIVMDDYGYRNKVRRAINTNPHVYNRQQEAFQGGYTHANWIYTDTILNDIDSFDFCSSYPYVLVTHKYPSTEFKKCNLKSADKMISSFAYLVVVKFKNIKCRYYNNIISLSKCRNVRNGRYDNGRVIQADELELTLTDIDFKLILEFYECEYEITESYYSKYNYLPKQFIEFILDKYVNKTKYKNVIEKYIEYNKEKNKFNALYGMTVTNTIRDNVFYDNETGWTESKLTNDEIIEALYKDKKNGFLSFSYGVWVTAFARNNLLKIVKELDTHTVYCDTDSAKLNRGYDKSVIDRYNRYVINKIQTASRVLDIPIERFAPCDVKGISHMLGIFEKEVYDDNSQYTYDKFVTQGAKKYAYEVNGKLHITVAGVPKVGAKALKSLEEFKDDFVFRHEYTNKNLLIYCENQLPIEIIDYQGNITMVDDISGCCLIPTTYVLGKSLDYANLISDNSSKRSRYIE